MKLLSKEDDTVAKKQPRKQFLNSSQNIVTDLLNKIKKKGDIRTLPDVITALDKMWSTIDAFPKLWHNKSP